MERRARALAPSASPSTAEATPEPRPAALLTPRAPEPVAPQMAPQPAEAPAAGASVLPQAMAFHSSRRPAAPPPAPPLPAAPVAIDPAGQMSLAGLAPDPKVDLPAAMLIRALNFPDSDDDAEGFAALRTALADPPVARLIRAAQDVLTLLAHDGIYMDELPADRARPDIWRRLAAGERGGGVAALGGVHDRTALARVAGRMRGDQVFRDTAHHFLRQFDRVFARFESTAQDAEIVAFADTRTARAFMLLARVAGLFD
jgi:hypothetical protein